MTPDLIKKVEGLEQHAAWLRNHIAQIRIDFPEAAEARRTELHDIYLKIAADRALLRAIEGRNG